MGLPSRVSLSLLVLECLISLLRRNMTHASAGGGQLNMAAVGRQVEYVDDISVAAGVQLARGPPARGH